MTVVASALLLGFFLAVLIIAYVSGVSEMRDGIRMKLLRAGSQVRVNSRVDLPCICTGPDGTGYRDMAWFEGQVGTVVQYAVPHPEGRDVAYVKFWSEPDLVFHMFVWELRLVKR